MTTLDKKDGDKWDDLFAQAPSELAWELICQALKEVHEDEITHVLKRIEKACRKWPRSLRILPFVLLRSSSASLARSNAFSAKLTFDHAFFFIDDTDLIDFLVKPGSIRLAKNDRSTSLEQDFLFRMVPVEFASEAVYLQTIAPYDQAVLFCYYPHEQRLENLFLFESSYQSCRMGLMNSINLFGVKSDYMLVGWSGEQEHWELYQNKNLIWTSEWVKNPNLLVATGVAPFTIYAATSDEMELKMLQWNGKTMNLISQELNCQIQYLGCAPNTLLVVDAQNWLYEISHDNFAPVAPMIRLSESPYPPLSVVRGPQQILSLQPYASGYSDINDQTINFFGGIYAFEFLEEVGWKLRNSFSFTAEYDCAYPEQFCVDVSYFRLVWVHTPKKGTPQLLLWEASSGSLTNLFSSESLHLTKGLYWLSEQVLRIVFQDQILDIKVDLPPS